MKEDYVASYNQLGYQLRDFLQHYAPAVRERLGLNTHNTYTPEQWDTFSKHPYIIDHVKTFMKTHKRVGIPDQDLISWSLYHSLKNEEETRALQLREQFYLI